MKEVAEALKKYEDDDPIIRDDLGDEIIEVTEDEADQPTQF